MAAEELQIVGLRDDFYRDSIGKVILIIIAICLTIGILVAVSLYLYFSKPPPVLFAVSEEWRVQPNVSIDQPYLPVTDLLQWVGDVLPKVFNYDFLHYNDQLQNASQYFTTNGWKIFLNQLNAYANYNNVQTSKLFIQGSPAGAPFILNQGLLSGRYAWWVQMPININYITYVRSNSQILTFQVLVVRVPTMNNLSGVGIDNVIVEKGAESQ